MKFVNYLAKTELLFDFTCLSFYLDEITEERTRA